jgi:hypothetical protein
MHNIKYQHVGVPTLLLISDIEHFVGLINEYLAPELLRHAQ